MDKKIELKNLKKWLLNKYVITLVGFAIPILFVGKSSLITQFRRAKEIDSVRVVVLQQKAEADKLENVVQSFDEKETLERIGREEFRMHAKDEDVFLVNPTK